MLFLYIDGGWSSTTSTTASSPECGCGDNYCTPGKELKSNTLPSCVISNLSRSLSRTVSQDVANYLLDNEDVLSSALEQLKRVPDLDKILNRIVSMQEGKCNARVVGANIKTIIAIKHTILVMQDLVASLCMHEDEGNEQAADGQASSRHPELLEAIVSNLIPPCSREVLEKIISVITESTMLSKGSLSAQHEECFAISIGTDGMLDVARKTYLQTVEDIYEHAEALTREFDCSVKVHNTQARGYHLKLPSTLESIPGTCFIQCVKSAKYIACTTREIASLSDRAQEALREALAITDRITYDLLFWIQVLFIFCLYASHLLCLVNSLVITDIDIAIFSYFHIRIFYLSGVSQ